MEYKVIKSQTAEGIADQLNELADRCPCAYGALQQNQEGEYFLLISLMLKVP